jgi:hypothetical protein
VACTIEAVKSMLRAGARRFENRGDDALVGADLRQLVDRSIAVLTSSGPSDHRCVVHSPGDVAVPRAVRNNLRVP